MKFGSDGSWLKDMKAMVTITFNGELQLLMWIELLEEKGFEVVNANTDGIITKIPNDRFEEYYAICNEWSAKTKVALEYTFYKKYYKRDVNNYIAETTNGKIKSKGREFGSDLDMLKGYKHPIVAKAVEDFFIKGIDFKKTILEHDDILDFCISQKVGKQFKIEEHKIVNGKLEIVELQHNIRYYVSTKGSGIVKRYVELPDKPKAKDNALTLFDIAPIEEVPNVKRLVAGESCVIINNLFYVADFKEYNVNYDFYIGQAERTIQGVYGQLYTHTSRSKLKTGRLLDDY